MQFPTQITRPQFSCEAKALIPQPSFLLIPPSAGPMSGRQTAIIYQAAGFSGLMSGHKQRTIVVNKPRLLGIVLSFSRDLTRQGLAQAGTFP